VLPEPRRGIRTIEHEAYDIVRNNKPHVDNLYPPPERAAPENAEDITSGAWAREDHREFDTLKIAQHNQKEKRRRLS
jgi:hypothetical protein